MKRKNAAGFALEWLQTDQRDSGKEPYIKPSSLARGCLLYVAFELQNRPKPAFEARVGRILSVGTDSHRRLQRGLSRACLAQEVFFLRFPSIGFTVSAMVSSMCRPTG
jgi:hypothetical protein